MLTFDETVAAIKAIPNTDPDILSRAALQVAAKTEQFTSATQIIEFLNKVDSVLARDNHLMMDGMVHSIAVMATSTLKEGSPPERAFAGLGDLVTRTCQRLYPVVLQYKADEEKSGKKVP